MKKVILAVSILATLGFVYAGVEGKGKGKGKKCCSSKSKCCSKDSTKSATPATNEEIKK